MSSADILNAVITLLPALGGVIGLYVVLAVYKYFLRPSINLKKYGEWAVVTGATDGIGNAICHELARKGINILLISRTEMKLKLAAEEIEKKYKVETEIYALDYSNFTEEHQSKLKDLFAKFDIGTLVNNVGMSYNFPQYLAEYPDEDVQNLYSLNSFSTVKMTQLLLPFFEAKKRGIIVNMSSGSSAMGGCPLLTMYAANKAFINEFSASLNYEYANSKNDIRVQAQIPLFVTSKLSKIRHASLSTPNPKTFAKCSVAQFGREALISPYPVHALTLYLASFLPHGFLMKQVGGMHLALRKRGKRKQEDAAKKQAE